MIAKCPVCGSTSMVRELYSQFINDQEICANYECKCGIKFSQFYTIGTTIIQKEENKYKKNIDEMFIKTMIKAYYDQEKK